MAPCRLGIGDSDHLLVGVAVDVNREGNVRSRYKRACCRITLAVPCLRKMQGKLGIQVHQQMICFTRVRLVVTKRSARSVFDKLSLGARHLDQRGGLQQHELSTQGGDVHTHQSRQLGQRYALRSHYSRQDSGVADREIGSARSSRACVQRHLEDTTKTSNSKTC